MKLFFVFFSILLISFSAFAQDELIGDKQAPPIELKTPKGKKYPAIIQGTDTIANLYLPTVLIIEDIVFKSKKEENKYKKLIRDVKKVYPYALAAGKKMKEYNLLLAGKSEAEKKRLMKEAENSLKKEFTKDIENMTVNQGRILLKLIDRETGNNSYHLIEEFRGGFSAFFWQSLGRIFDVNLKTQYDPDGEDKQIENIVLMIQKGLI
jgi:hypothetical protein